ncbi:ATP-binding protein [Pseudonocardia sp. RS11V-5]|uniref:ATP-binding protein n=1 Tax=Pseudonocardia terrae TaxID=2905831 RepID=UPI001E5CD00F|nr:ATP-binding protein [Pseudonocardia terrae]MCE3552957.1 ATP-binding protein [Pseudonocardia terrae]
MNADSRPARDPTPARDAPPAHLPAALPLLPDLRLAALWVPATPPGPAAIPSADGAAPAGDWLDVVPLPDGRLALAVGDLVGPAPRPGAVTGLRTVLRQALHTAPSLAEALEQVDRAASVDTALHGASLTVVVVGPDGELEHARGAHPPALVRGPDGLAPLPGQAYGPLGVGAAPPVPHRARLARGDTLLLYSDDLVEGRGRTRPGRGGGNGLRLDRDTPSDDPAALCDRIAARAPRGGVAVLAAYRPLTPVEPLRLVLPVDPFALSPLRETVTRWLEAAGVAPRTVVAAPMVVSELAANAIEHAYPEGATGEIRVDAELTGAGLSITVADDGTWRPPETDGPEDDADGAGFGLAVVRDLCDAVVVDPGPDGTSVTAVLAVGRPVAVGDAPRPRPEAVPEMFAVRPGEVPGVLHVHGDVDLPAVPTLRAALLDAAADGEPCVLDLSATTLFASAGVRLLHQLDPDTDLRVVAPPGSVARPVLELTGLAHLLTDRAESA